MPSTRTPSISSPSRRRRRLRTTLAVGATCAAVAVSGLTAGTASAASAQTSSISRANRDTARYGAGYLARQLVANGGFLGSAAAPDLSDTAYAVLALHAAGVGAKASNEAVAWLKSQVGSGLAGSDGQDDAGRLSYTILAAVSAGQNPRAFGGSAARNDLVARLLATARTTGSDRGLFGSSDPTYDGAFRQGVALQALAAAKVAAGSVTASIGWLTGQQCANGFWTSYRASTTTACAAADPATFAGPDTNSTGMAAQGLAAYGRHPRQSALVATFHRIQSADGGFPFLAAAGQASDPDSTALSIQGLIAYGAKPGLPAFRSGSHTPYVALAGYQLGCSDPAADRGAFFYPGARTPSILATVQAVPAAAQRTFPLAASTVTTAVPRPTCTASSTNTVASARPSAVAALAGHAGHCTGGTGVTVAVDFTAFGGKVTVRCAPGKPATGVAALQQAGFTPAGTATYGLAFVCRINSLPSTAQQPCVTTPPTNAYWAYYHANKGATTWTFSAQGASTYKPAQGSIDAWAFGNSAKPSKTPAQVRKTTT